MQIPARNYCRLPLHQRTQERERGRARRNVRCRCRCLHEPSFARAASDVLRVCCSHSLTGFTSAVKKKSQSVCPSVAQSRKKMHPGSCPLHTQKQRYHGRVSRQQPWKSSERTSSTASCAPRGLSTRSPSSRGSSSSERRAPRRSPHQCRNLPLFNQERPECRCLAEL